MGIRDDAHTMKKTQEESESIVRQLSSCFFCRHYHRASLILLCHSADGVSGFAFFATRLRPSHLSQLNQSPLNHRKCRNGSDPPTHAVDDLRTCDGTKWRVSSSALHHTYFSFRLFPFLLPSLRSHVTDHTDTYRFFSHTMSFSF